MINEEVFSATDQIRRLEHECDKYHSIIYKNINKIEKIQLNPFVAIQIAQAIDLIEAISDRVEDVADYIELLKTLDL